MTDRQTDPKTEPTPLDQAHAAMTSAPDDDAARLRFYERIADVELFMLLEDEPQGDQICPVLLDDSYVMVFDRAARLSAHVGRRLLMWRSRGVRLPRCWRGSPWAWR